MSNKQHSLNRTRLGRTVFVGILVLALLLTGCGAQKPKVYRVGVLSGLDFFAPAVDSFKAKMAELGYVEGENITYDVQKTNIDFAAYETILKKFVEDKVDLIFVFPTEASQIAKSVTQGTDIPIVFALAFTEAGGIVDSVREPGGNITGVRFPGPEVATKRLGVLLEMAPDAKRIWVPYFRDYPSVPSQLGVLHPLAEAAGITLIEFPASSPDELQAELDARAASSDIGMDAILMIAEPLMVTPDLFGVVGKFAFDYKVPLGGAIMGAGDYGTMFGWTPTAESNGVEAAILADKIFNGTQAGTIPVVSAESALVINLPVAQALGVTVPEGLLKQADQIIK